MDNNRYNYTNSNQPAVHKKSCPCSTTYADSIDGSHVDVSKQETRKNCSQPQAQNPICHTIKEYDNDLLGEGDTAHVNLQLNETFMRRIHDIDNMAGNNLALKVVTYREWVDTLLFVNENMLSCIIDLESGIAERVAEAQKMVSIPCQSSTLPQVFQEEQNPLAAKLAMVQRDINRMKTLVRCGFYYKSWDADHLKFETVTPEEIFKEDELISRTSGGMQPNYEHFATSVRFNPVDQMNKIDVNVKALAYEVANKHDEIRELKKQINSLEEEIQNAQKKIQLKDNVIKELRTDLKSNAIKNPTQISKINNMSSNNRNDVYESASSHEFTNISAENMAILEKDLQELFTTSNAENMEHHRRHLTEVLRKAECDKLESQRKFDHLCASLADIEKDCALIDKNTYEDFVGKFGSQGDFDDSMKLVNALRKRFINFNEKSYELKKNIHLINIEKSEINDKLLTEKAFSQHVSEVMRQVADLLSNLTKTHFTYDDVYNPKSKRNPFCEFIKSMVVNFESREKKLQEKLDNLAEKVSSLNDIMNKNETSKREVIDTEISAITTATTTTTPPTQPTAGTTQTHQRITSV